MKLMVDYSGADRGCVQDRKRSPSICCKFDRFSFQSGAIVLKTPKSIINSPSIVECGENRRIPRDTNDIEEL
jgi:hypothetical protein